MLVYAVLVYSLLVCRWFKGGRRKLCLEVWVSCDTVVNVWTVWQCRYSSVFGALKWSSQRRPGNQAVHFVCFQPSLLSRLHCLSQFLRLLQSFQFLVTSSFSWSIRVPKTAKQIQTWTNKDSACSSAKICAPCLANSGAKGRSAAELEEKELSVVDGCVLWGARVIVPPPGRQQVIHELHKIHVHPGIAKMKS